MAIYLVLGASGKLGSSVASLLKSSGHVIYLASPDPPEADLISCDTSMWFRCDLSDPTDVFSIVSAFVLSDKVLDGIVNCAWDNSPLSSDGTMDFSVWSRALAVNLFGPLTLVKWLKSFGRLSERSKIVVTWRRDGLAEDAYPQLVSASCVRNLFWMSFPQHVVTVSYEDVLTKLPEILGE
jgi:NAD(P)-dependent dehydrogenase (short-subunit alcohol dehydrogenase family)